MDIVTRLEAARDQTLRYFDLSNEPLERNYGSGKWSVRFILHHLADAETVLFDRIRRVLSEPRQVLWAFDQDAWAAGLDYSKLPLDLLRRIYDAVRAGVIYQARLPQSRQARHEYSIIVPHTTRRIRIQLGGAASHWNPKSKANRYDRKGPGSDCYRTSNQEGRFAGSACGQIGIQHLLHQQA